MAGSYIFEPMKWVDDWPVIGNNGEPVATFKKPATVKASAVTTPVESDEFDGAELGEQWQWQANPQANWALPSKALGVLRLFCLPMPEGAKNLWDVPNVLLQKFPAPEFTAVTKVSFHPMADNERAGLVVMGSSYAYIAVERKGAGLSVSQVVCNNAERGAAEKTAASVTAESGDIYLRVRVAAGAKCRFAYSRDGEAFVDLGESFQAVKGRWIGAKVGLFATRASAAGEFGYADVDWFRVAGN